MGLQKTVHGIVRDADRVAIMSFRFAKYGREVNYLRDKYFVISWQKVEEWAFEVNALSPASKCFHVLLAAM